MASRQLQALTQRGSHTVGNLNSIKIKTLAHGALVTGGDIDNFTLVELGFGEDGERTVKQLSAVDNKAYLIASPEARYLGEDLVDFYNAEGERARIVILEEGYTRFDTSAYAKNTDSTDIKNGQVAHFDPASKKFIISAPGSAHADYAGASAQFVVVNAEDDLEYVAGKPVVRLEVTKA